MLVYLVGLEGVIEELARMGATPQTWTLVQWTAATTSPAPRTARPVPAWSTPRCSRGWTLDRSWGSFQDALMVDLDDTEGAPRERASTWAPWPGRWTWSPAPTPGCACAATGSSSSPRCRVRSKPWTSPSCNGQVIQVSLDHQHPGAGGQLREGGSGDHPC
ncbi:hypothetical protein QJS66_08820 [Kocuria rhizophila]|nr:hypothetical protein QJS66_08820 [Kocuria rhizophila]